MAKVLILEDEDTGKIYKDYLMKQLPDHEFIWRTDIASAKATINQDYSVVVLDQRLGHNELGTTFMRWCKEQYPHINGILFSSWADKADVSEAHNNKWIMASKEKGREGLAELPGLIMTAIDDSACKWVLSQTNHAPKEIGKIRTWKSFFVPTKVYKVSECVVNSEFVDDSLWDTVAVMHAGQKTTEKKARETVHSVSVKCDSRISIGFSNQKLNDIITRNMDINTDINYAYTSESTEKNIDETIVESVMPSIESDPNKVGISSVKIQVNQIYEVRSICLKVTCPICDSDKYINCEVHVPTKREKSRKVIVYSDGSKRILDI